MCKIMVMTNASKVSDMPKFTRYMAGVLSDMRDGFGAAMRGDKGVYTVKTLYPNLFARGITPIKFTKRIPDAISGIESTNYGPAMFHGRVSTNKVNLVNTHPMINKGNYLIHNGVVTNLGEDYEKTTTNDSEDVLHHYLKGGIDSVAANLSGYYACGVINSDGTLSVFRDSIANLFCAWSDKLDSYIFATTESIIDKVGKFIEEELSASEVMDNIYLKFNGNTLIEERLFEPTERISDYARSLSSKSLGRSLDSDWTDYRYNAPKSSYSWSDDYMDIDEETLADTTDEYLEMLEVIDDTYTVQDEYGKHVDVEEFRRLSLSSQVTCQVKRPNGIIVNPFGPFRVYSKRA